jgi:carboxyl-terminal processing protease
MRLTISKYYLPSGKSISEVGVTPDILVEEIGVVILSRSILKKR